MGDFGQVVVGPPGSGKTLYCKAMAQLLTDLGRKVAIINLDPANDILPYTADVEINELVSVKEVMETQHLGPNGALIFCMELLVENISWLIGKLKQLRGCYLMFDFPGQAELYVHYMMIRNLLVALMHEDIHLAAVHLVDAHYANDPGKYISALMLALGSMLQLEVPTVNVLSKIDTAEKYGKLEFGLEFYTEVLDLTYLMESLDGDPFLRHYAKLNAAIAETDCLLLGFICSSVC